MISCNYITDAWSIETADGEKFTAFTLIDYLTAQSEAEWSAYGLRAMRSHADGGLEAVGAVVISVTASEALHATLGARGDTVHLIEANRAAVQAMLTGAGGGALDAGEIEAATIAAIMGAV